jgi:hypothetical protein
VSGAALVLIFSVVTNRYYSWNQSTHAFGFGVFESNFPISASEFVREAELPSPLSRLAPRSSLERPSCHRRCITTCRRADI